jgi:phage repressor protein C with HTH and peptisase S24 domain
MAAYKHKLQIRASDNYVDRKVGPSPIISMTKGTLAQQIGIAIRTARKRRGLVQRNIAEHVGVKTAAVGQWEIGTNLPSTENLVRTAEKLRVDPTALTRGELIYLGDDDLGDAEIVTDLTPANALGPMDLEVRGVAYGGDEGDFSFNGEVASYIRRPPGIANVRNVFALNLLSDSMEPRFSAGEVIVCGGREPVPGDDVVIEMFPENEGEAGKAFVKRLLRRTSKDIVVKQFNPERELIFDRYGVKTLWRVIPTKELLGF